MGSYIRWGVPCNYSKNGVQELIEFDFTEHINAMFSNKVWERKYDYGDSEYLEQFKPGDIKSCKITIVPRILFGISKSNRNEKIILERFGELPDDLKIENFLGDNNSMGLIIFELEYNYFIAELPEDNTIYSYTSQFLYEYNKANALLQEIGAFFLAGLNLLFVKKTTLMKSEHPIHNGMLQMVSGEKKYFHHEPTSLFTHYVFIEDIEIKEIDFTFRILCSVWHYNLWSVRRYLIAMESSKINMDNLLDLIYALESLFQKNTSTDFIKTMCVVQFSPNKEEAKNLYSYLTKIFNIRNEMVHGGITYSVTDIINLKNKKVPAEEFYWVMKRIVGTMILRAIFKLVKDQNQKNLRYSAEDLWDKIYKTEK